MLHFTLFADTITGLVYQASGLVLQIGVGIAVIFIIRAAVETVGFLGKISSRVGKTGESLTGKARDRAQQTKFAQRREFARNFKKQERQRGATEDYANLVQRSAHWRRRSAGRGNEEGQVRSLQNAQDTIRKLRRDEAERASKDIARMGFEGDNDFMGIARAGVGGNYTNAAGQSIRVTEAVQQAAVDNLVKQGRIRQLRNLEGELNGRDAAGNDIVTPAGSPGRRGPGGQSRTQMHEVLDRAYEEFGSKVAEKAPDMAPSRRASNGTAAFTDLKPEDVVAWQETTYDAAERYYSDAGRNGGNGDQQRQQMLRAYLNAVSSPSTRSRISVTQAQGVERMLAAHPGTTGLTTAETATIRNFADTLGA